MSKLRYKRVALALLVLTLVTTTTSCKRSDVAGNQSNVSGNANRVGEETVRVPPFSTKEPERYQAIRMITTVSGPAGLVGADETKTVTSIARDGERRREDYEVAGSKVSSLQTRSGTYLLLPDKKIYADMGSNSRETAKTSIVPPDFSPEKLLNETRPEALFEDLGPETVDGRSTRKYRVNLRGKIGAARETSTETLIWIDEKLGMPIRTEMTSAGSARVITELRDIRETVDEGVFDLPADYRKVGEREFFSLLKSGDVPGKGR